MLNIKLNVNVCDKGQDKIFNPATQGKNHAINQIVPRKVLSMYYYLSTFKRGATDSASHPPAGTNVQCLLRPMQVII